MLNKVNNKWSPVNKIKIVVYKSENIFCLKISSMLQGRRAGRSGYWAGKGGGVSTFPLKLEINFHFWLLNKDWWISLGPLLLPPTSSTKFSNYFPGLFKSTRRFSFSFYFEIRRFTFFFVSLVVGCTKKKKKEKNLRTFSKNMFW